MGLKHYTKTRDKDDYIAQRKSAMNSVANRCSALHCLLSMWPVRKPPEYTCMYTIVCTRVSKLIPLMWKVSDGWRGTVSEMMSRMFGISLPGLLRPP